MQHAIDGSLDRRILRPCWHVGMANLAYVLVPKGASVRFYGFFAQSLHICENPIFERLPLLFFFENRRCALTSTSNITDYHPAPLPLFARPPLCISLASNKESKASIRKVASAVSAWFSQSLCDQSTDLSPRNREEFWS